MLQSLRPPPLRLSISPPARNPRDVVRLIVHQSAIAGLAISHDLARVADGFQISGLISLNGARSGPAISTMPFAGSARATSATKAATSSAEIGWNRPVENPHYVSIRT